MDFNNRVVWITGASSGIGKALAEELCLCSNAKMIISARNEKALKELKGSLEKKEEKRIFVLPLDLSDHGSLGVKAEKALGKWGAVDHLINNAGISQRSLIMDTDFAVIKKIIDVDLLGTIALTRHVLPYMAENSSGHITVISSVAGKFTTPLRSVYSAAKRGLSGFFDGLRLESRVHNIRVTMIYPGFIKTAVSVNALDGKGEKHGIMDTGQENGMSAGICAGKIIHAIEKNASEKYIGISPKVRLALLLKKYFPGLLDRILSKADPT